MRTALLLSLAACFFATACADHVGDAIVVADSPQPPVNQPDNGAITPPIATDTGSNTNTGTGGGTTSTVTEGNGQGGAGGSGGTTQGSGGSTEGSNPPAGVDGGTGAGGQGGQPVPEPSTLLLVGTGLAAASLLRRRRQANQAK